MEKKLLNLCFSIILIIVNFNLCFAQLKKCKTGSIASIQANPVKRMVIPYLADTVILDGIKDAAYKDSFRLTSLIKYSTTSTFDVTQTHRHGAVINMGWRNEGIYLFANIADNTDFGGPNWNQDGVQIDIDSDTTLDDVCGDWPLNTNVWEIGINRDTNVVRYSNKSDTKGTYHAIVQNCNGFAPGADTGHWGVNPAGNIPFVYHWHAIPGVKFAIINDQYVGYTVEALYPWAFLVPYYLHGVTVDSIVKRTMGFDIAVADNETCLFTTGTKGCNGSNAGTERDHSLLWDQDGGKDSTYEANYLNADAVNANTKLMGRITFEPKPIIKPNIVGVTASYTFGMFPNPAKDVVNFSNLKNVTSLEIINIYGQIVQNVNVSLSTTQVNVSNLAEGIYVVKAVDVSGRGSFGKLIIK